MKSTVYASVYVSNALDSCIWDLASHLAPQLTNLLLDLTMFRYFVLCPAKFAVPRKAREVCVRISMDRSVTECELGKKRPYSTRLRCRAAESDCFGNVRVYSGRACRERGYRDDVSLCATHSRLLRDEYHRCALTFDSISCSGTLESCPERIFAALEEITGVPSAYLCRFHRKGVDSMDAVVSHPLYRPPPKRATAAIQPVHRVCFRECMLFYITFLVLQHDEGGKNDAQTTELTRVKEELDTCHRRIVELEEENRVLREKLQATENKQGNRWIRQTFLKAKIFLQILGSLSNHFSRRYIGIIFLIVARAYTMPTTWNHSVLSMHPAYSKYC